MTSGVTEGEELQMFVYLSFSHGRLSIAEGKRVAANSSRVV